MAGCSVTPGAAGAAGVDAGVAGAGRQRRCGWPSSSLGLAAGVARVGIAVARAGCRGLAQGRSSAAEQPPRGQLGLARHKAGVRHDVFQTPHPRSSPLTMPLPEAPAVLRASHHTVFSRRGARCLPGSLVGSRCHLPAFPNWHPLSLELWFPCSAAMSLLPQIIT